MKILFAGIFHETHCFTSDRTTLADFRIERGDFVFTRRGDGSQIDGFFEVADREGWTVLPTAAYTAMPSGIVAADVFEAFWREVEPIASASGRQGIDAIYLSLHGAMVTEAIDDVEGELLRRLRAISGLRDIPLFGVFDLHANFTEAMAANANGLVCYRENPHTDARATGVRAAELLKRSLQGGGLPQMYRLNPPIVWPPTGTGTADSPMRDLEALAREIERDNPDIWAANVVAGFSFADVFDAGVSFSVVTAGSERAARNALSHLAEAAMTMKDRGYPPEHSVDEVLRSLAPEEPGPAIIVEPADNVAGGAPGDGTGVLRALIRNRVERACVVINDPDAVRSIAAAPIGHRVSVAIGGKGSTLDEGPVTLQVEIISRSDGRFELEDIQSHLAASQGRNIDMGPCAVVAHAGLTILLTSLKTPPFDLGQLRSQGIEPTRMRVICVKAGVGHRRAYDPITRASFTVTTPGPCTSDSSRLPYTKLRRGVSLGPGSQQQA
jgi:microcystin degradation protein MlrC